MLALTLVVIARFWLGLTASATALDIIRGGGRWRPTRWVPAWLTQQLGEIGAAISSLPATAHVVPLAARVGLDALGYAVVAAVYDQLGGNPAVSETTHA